LTTFIKIEHCHAQIFHFNHLIVSSFRLILNLLKAFCHLFFILIGFKEDFIIDLFQNQKRTKTLRFDFKHFIKQLKIDFNDGS